MRIALALLLGMPVMAQAQEHGHHAHHGGEAVAPAPSAVADATIEAPPAPADHAADALYDPVAMARSRDALRRESGGMGQSMLLIDRLEWRPARGGDGYAWEVEGWTGGDIDRLAIKSKGEGVFGGPLEKAEVQAGWLHAIDPWFNVRAGIRQDLRPRPMRTQAVLAVEGLAPYWFHVSGELFLSHEGEISARAEASYDQRITQSLIAQPAAELNLSAQDVPKLYQGTGLTSVELGLRLRYEIVREFAPYMGLHWERKLGRTADYARAEGEDADGLRFVAGLRFWF